MAVRHLDKDHLACDEDWEGNNAAFSCPVCRKVFLVSGSSRIHDGKRECPNCRSSIGYVLGGKKSDGSARIEWEKRDVEPMNDYEVALMDAVRTIMEVLVAKDVVTPAMLDKALEAQQTAYPQHEMPGALFVMRMIRETLTDPERARVRSFLNRPPEGSA